MRLSNLTITSILLFLVGCVGFPLQKPQENDLVGEWESTGLTPYSMIDYRQDKSSYLVMVSAEEEYNLSEISEFTTNDNEFTIKISDTESGEVTIFVGSFWGGQLSLHESGFEELTMWFTKSYKLSELQAVGRSAINMMHAED
jgi:hypothetical protein